MKTFQIALAIVLGTAGLASAKPYSADMAYGGLVFQLPQRDNCQNAWSLQRYCQRKLQLN